MSYFGNSASGADGVPDQNNSELFKNILMGDGESQDNGMAVRGPQKRYSDDNEYDNRGGNEGAATEQHNGNNKKRHVVDNGNDNDTTQKNSTNTGHDGKKNDKQNGDKKEAEVQQDFRHRVKVVMDASGKQNIAWVNASDRDSYTKAYLSKLPEFNTNQDAVKDVYNSTSDSVRQLEEALGTRTEIYGGAFSDCLNRVNSIMQSENLSQNVKDSVLSACNGAIDNMLKLVNSQEKAHNDIFCENVRQHVKARMRQEEFDKTNTTLLGSMTNSVRKLCDTLYYPGYTDNLLSAVTDNLTKAKILENVLVGTMNSVGRNGMSKKAATAAASAATASSVPEKSDQSGSVKLPSNVLSLIK